MIHGIWSWSTISFYAYGSRKSFLVISFHACIKTYWMWACNVHVNIHQKHRNSSNGLNDKFSINKEKKWSRDVCIY
jgi:hypothetical protein